MTKLMKRKWVEAGEPYDWKWRTAQPGDLWIPKRGKAGKEIRYTNAMGSGKEMICLPVQIQQHHNADKSALVLTEYGRQASIKWRSLKANWKPATERPLRTQA